MTLLGMINVGSHSVVTRLLLLSTVILCSGRGRMVRHLERDYWWSHVMLSNSRFLWWPGLLQLLLLLVLLP
jgi:hypothetical protein